MNVKYLKESFLLSLQEYCPNHNLSDDDITKLMSDIGISIDNYSTYMGHDDIPNPVIEIRKNLTDDHKKELERSNKIISDLRDQITDMKNIPREHAVISTNGNTSCVQNSNPTINRS